MAEQTSGTIDIEASAEEVMSVLTDFGAYPKWAQGIRKTEVRKKDSLGRGKEVYMEASSKGVGAKYTLSYRYKAKNGGMTWTSKDCSGAVKSITGGYELKPTGSTTKVTYRTTIELAIPVVGFIKRQAEKQIINSALGGLKKEVERR